MVVFNTLTGTKKLNKEYLNSLQRRDMLNKFSFIGEEQAKTWIDICNSDEYKNFEETVQFMHTIKKEIAKIIKNDINLISLGSASGYKSKILIKELLKSQTVNFIAIDPSLQTAKNTIESMQDLDISKDVFISSLTYEYTKDISERIRKRSNLPNLFVILSNTFGTHPQELIAKSLREAMNNSDYALIGVNISPDRMDPQYIQDNLHKYSSPIFKKRTLLTLLPANVTMDDGVVETEYNTDTSFLNTNRITQYFRFTKPKIVSFVGENVYFTKDERIRIKYSNKYRIDTLRQIITGHGFSIKKEFLSPSGEHMKILCKLA